MKDRPNPDTIIPNPKIPSLCYIKNVIKNPNIIVGDYTYYDDVNGAEQFEKHVTHHYSFIKGDTIVGNDVWIGQNVTVMPGVHIGDGAIIGANSVVAKDIPPYTIAVGNPCRVIKKRFDDELIDLLLKLKWWDRSIEEIEELMPLLSCWDLQMVKKRLSGILG